MLYKNKDCINELGLGMPEIDFGESYKKVQNKYELENRDLIVAIIDKKSNKRSNPITSYAFYNPENGDKLDAEEICKEEVIIVKENIKSLLNESVSDIDSILYLTNQNINVFNKSSEFYTNLCYHFDSPCGKDVALKDRLLIYYPNITLCDSGCTNTGVNLSAMIAICGCKYKDLNVDDLEEETNIYKDVVNKVNEILNQINLAVMGCYKDLFEYEYFISNTGGIILLVLIIIKIVNLFIYYYSSLFLINKYIYSVVENYILFLNKSPLVNTKIINYKNENNNDNKENNPPKKNPSNKNGNIKKNKKPKENLNDENMLSYVKLKKRKKIKNKLQLYSSKNIEKSEITIKSNNTSLLNKSKENTNFTFENYLSTDLDDMNFHDVSLSDKRLFFDYLCDKMKKKQVILELFYIKDQLKPITIKILLIILDIEICFVVNAMFINEDYISDLFHSKKEENFISFLPRSINRCLYTIFSSIVVNYFIRCLFVEESQIKGVLRRDKNDITNMKLEINKIMKEIKIRYNIFIIMVTIFSLFSWFYLSCFNNIYPHTKIEWIKSSIFSYLLIQLLSIIVILIETLLRFISFEIKSERMYRLSLWLG